MKNLRQNYLYGILIAFGILVFTTVTGQPPIKKITPGEKGQLPVFTPLSGLQEGKIAGLAITKVDYYYSRMSGRIYYYPQVDLEFPKPEAVGAETYTLQSFDVTTDTWSDMVYNEKVLTTNGNNFSIRFDGNKTFRLKVNGGEKNGYTSNQVTASIVSPPTSIQSSAWQPIWGPEEGIPNAPYVGCAYLVDVAVRVYDAKKKDFVAVQGDDHYIYEWYRRNPINYEMTKIEGANKKKYYTTTDDIGYQIVGVIKGDATALSFYREIKFETIRLSIGASFDYLSDDGFILNAEYSGITDFNLIKYDRQQQEIIYHDVATNGMEELIPGQYKVYADFVQGKPHLIKLLNPFYDLLQVMEPEGRGLPIEFNISSGTLKAELKIGGQSTEGSVNLIKKDIYGNMALSKTKQTKSGKTEFKTITGCYLLKATKTDETLDSYFPNVTMWEEALQIEQPIWNDTTFVITVQPKPTMPEGMCEVSGVISLKSAKGTRRSASMAIYDLYLKDKKERIIAHTQNDAQGKYTFQQIPFGSYQVLLNIENYPMKSVHEVILTAKTPKLSDIDYEISKDAVEAKSALGIFAMDSIPLTFYPNPVTNILYLPTSAVGNQVKIYNLTGQCVYMHLLVNNRMDVSTLPSGVYLIQIEHNNQIQKGKFLKR